MSESIQLSVQRRQDATNALSAMAAEAELAINDMVGTIEEQYDQTSTAVAELDDQAQELIYGQVVEVSGTYTIPTVTQEGSTITFATETECGVRRGISRGFIGKRVTTQYEESKTSIADFKIFHQIYIGEVSLDTGTSAISGPQYLLAHPSEASLSLVDDLELIEQDRLYTVLLESLPGNIFEDLHLALHENPQAVNLQDLSKVFDQIRETVDESTVENALSYTNIVIGFSNKHLDVIARYLTEVSENGNHKTIIDTPEVISGICSDLQWGPSIVQENGVLTYSNKEQLSLFLQARLEGEEEDRLLIIGAPNVQDYQVLGRAA